MKNLFTLFSLVSFLSVSVLPSAHAADWPCKAAYEQKIPKMEKLEAIMEVVNPIGWFTVGPSLWVGYMVALSPVIGAAGVIAAPFLALGTFGLAITLITGRGQHTIEAYRALVAADVAESDLDKNFKEETLAFRQKNLIDNTETFNKLLAAKNKEQAKKKLPALTNEEMIAQIMNAEIPAHPPTGIDFLKSKIESNLKRKLSYEQVRLAVQVARGNADLCTNPNKPAQLKQLQTAVETLINFSATN